jgi:hypothetical protein
MKSIDAVLQLSQGYGTTVSEPGILVVEFIFSIVWQLIDATLDDEGLLELTSDKKSKWVIKSQEMEIDHYDSYDEKRTELQQRLQNLNTVMAIELIGQFLQNKVTSRILYLARRNMYVYRFLIINCFSNFVHFTFNCVQVNSHWMTLMLGWSSIG